jgi:hypothetical protein
LIPKVVLFEWTALHEKILPVDNLVTRGMQAFCARPTKRVMNTSFQVVVLLTKSTQTCLVLVSFCRVTNFKFARRWTNKLVDRKYKGDEYASSI